MPSTPRIRTHNSHRHNTTQPLQTLVLFPYLLSTYNTHTTATQTQTHVHRIGKAKTQSSHPRTLSPPTPPRAKHIHITHTPPTLPIPRTTLIPSTSPALDPIAEPRVPHTCPALTTTTSPPSHTPAFPSPSHPHTISAYTQATQITVHASQSQQPPHPHRIPRQPHRHTKDDHMTTDTTQAYRPHSKSVRNLILLQVNINGINNKLDELKLLIHDTHADIITIQETKLTPKAKYTHYITSPPCLPIGYTSQGVGLIHSLETTLHSPQHTYLRPLIHTTHNFKWSRYTITALNKTHITDTHHCIQYITKIPHSVVTGDVNTHSTLLHSYTDDHTG